MLSQLVPVQHLVVEPGPALADGGYSFGGGVSDQRVVATGRLRGTGIFGPGEPREVGFPFGVQGTYAATYTHEGDFRCVWGFYDADLHDASVDPEGGVVVVGDFSNNFSIVRPDGTVLGGGEAIDRGGQEGFIVRFAPRAGFGSR